MRAVVCRGPGGPEQLELAEVPDPTPGPGEVLIAVAAAGVNRADLLQRRGLYPPPPGASELLGLEVSGRVLALGSGASQLQPGQEVMALLTGGGYAERVVAPAGCVLGVPPGLDLVEAGGLLEVFVTAWLNLVELGELRAGERVLIQGGGGGVGHAAVQLAALRNAEVWATAGGPEGVAWVESLGARGIDYRGPQGFAAALQEAGGADLILDCLGASALRDHLDALAPDGRLVVIGLQGGSRAELPLATLLARRLRIIGSTLRALPLERKAALLTRFAAAVLPELTAGRLRVEVAARYPLAETAAAHARLEEGGVRGKLVLVP